MADSVIDQGVKESVANENMKTVGGASSFYTAQGMGDSLANQRRMNQLAEMEIADKIAHSKRMDILAEGQVANAMRGLGDMTNPDTPQDAVAAQKLLTGNDIGQQMLQLNSVVADQKAEIASLIALVQQLVKGAQSTPPETAVPAKV